MSRRDWLRCCNHRGVISLHRRVGEDTQGAPVVEQLSGMLCWPPQQASVAKSNPPPRESTDVDPAVLSLRLKQAEEEVAQKELAFKNHAISEGEFDEAKVKVELLKAEMDGDPKGVIQVKLDAAKRDLERASNKSKAGIIPVAEFEAAKDKVEVLTAELNGDPVQIAQVNLTAARRRLDLAASRYEVGAIPSAEFSAAKSDVAIAEARLRAAEEQVRGRATNGSPRLGR